MKKFTEKEIFSFGLYKEGLRRVKLPGIIFFVILALEAIVTPIGTVVSYADYEGSIKINTISALNVHPLMVISIFIITPIFTWTLFSFLNKRHASDHYHSLPHTRLALFISTLASLITWIVGLLVSTSLLSVIGHLMYPKYFSVMFSSYVSAILGCISASVLVAAVVIIAMSITGTGLNNVVVSGLILFLPRTLISFISEAVVEKVPVVPRGYLSTLMSSKINIMTGWLDGIFFSGRDYVHNTGLTGSASQLYTFILALIYLALGCILFIRRKSESAEKSAPTRFLQAVYRITVAMVICTPVCFFLFTEGISDSDDLFGVTVLYIIVAIAYFSYEIISTRKWKNLIKAIPGLGIVALLNVALCITMNCFYRSELGFAPEPEDIRYVRLMNDTDNALSYNNTVRFEYYAESLSERVRLTDDTSLKIVSDSLKENIAAIEDDEYYSTYVQTYRYDGSYEEKYKKCTFLIKSGLTEKFRTLYLTVSDYGKIVNTLESEEDYKKSWTVLPNAVSDSMQITTGNVVMSLSKGDGARLLDTLSAEVAELDFEVWRKYISSNGEFYSSVIGSFAYAASYNGSPKNLSISISPIYLPKTSQVYFEMINAQRKTSDEELREKLLGDDGNSYVYINSHSLYEYNSSTQSYESRYVSLKDNDPTDNRIHEFVSSILKGRDPTIGESFVLLTVRDGEWKFENGKEYVLYDYGTEEVLFVPLTDDELERFEEFSYTESVDYEMYETEATGTEPFEITPETSDSDRTPVTEA